MNTKFIPREKLSKKARKELNSMARKTWGEINPVTRKPANPKVYNRKKLRKDGESFPELFHSVLVCQCPADVPAESFFVSRYIQY